MSAEEGGIVSTEAGATLGGKPFVIVLVNGERTGQLTPGEAIAMGTRFIQSGIEAERDAGMVNFLRSCGVEDGKIGDMVAGLREHRQQHEPAEGRVGGGGTA